VLRGTDTSPVYAHSICRHALIQGIGVRILQSKWGRSAVTRSESRMMGWDEDGGKQARESIARIPSGCGYAVRKVLRMDKGMSMGFLGLRLGLT
jgi:hypothetical protein